MEPNGSVVVEGAKENGADSDGSLEPEEHGPSAVDVNPLPVLLSAAECDACARCLQYHLKRDAPIGAHCLRIGPSTKSDQNLLCSCYGHPPADGKLQPCPSPSKQVIDDALVTKVRENEYPKEIILLDQKDAEWSFYPRHGHLHTYHKGKKCYFNGVFRAYQRCSTEITLDKCFGRKKYDIDLRNGLPELIPGDKTYLHPEQCPDFYKHGATVPPVNFSRVPYVKEVDTFIPLEPLSKQYHLPFSEKDKKKQQMNEIMEVKELDDWKPAVPLMVWLFPAVPLTKPLKVVTI
ncbi:spermatogenesis-associated serine-rich protein 1 [Vombatus ursinus]|uniref:Spermatogenesis associated serine rich 1 n=1 Tax=Vombatus ursinus TaxID=29139 RepID=A0A4X2K7C4_VOMUR|nr:spermatogenesis-associated serine-rich protein 1 [Vombatus ursinus]